MRSSESPEESPTPRSAEAKPKPTKEAELSADKIDRAVELELVEVEFKNPQNPAVKLPDRTPPQSLKRRRERIRQMQLGQGIDLRKTSRGEE